MTIEIALALLAFVTALGGVARMVFWTEAKVAHMGESQGKLASKETVDALVAANTKLASKESVDAAVRSIESLNGKALAMDSLASEGKTAHFALAASFEALTATVAGKASAESVVSLKESVEGLRRDIHDGFGRNERQIADVLARLDRTTTTTRKRTT